MIPWNNLKPERSQSDRCKRRSDKKFKNYLSDITALKNDLSLESDLSITAYFEQVK